MVVVRDPKEVAVVAVLGKVLTVPCSASTLDTPMVPEATCVVMVHVDIGVARSMLMIRNLC